MRVFRQGDVVIREVKELPKPHHEYGVKPFEDGEIRITGETGNDHVLPKVKVAVIDRVQFIQTGKEGAVMTHEEHPPLVLPPVMVARVERVRTVSGPATD